MSSLTHSSCEKWVCNREQCFACISRSSQSIDSPKVQYRHNGWIESQVKTFTTFHCSQDVVTADEQCRQCFEFIARGPRKCQVEARAMEQWTYKTAAFAMVFDVELALYDAFLSIVIKFLSRWLYRFAIFPDFAFRLLLVIAVRIEPNGRQKLIERESKLSYDKIKQWCKY